VAHLEAHYKVVMVVTETVAAVVVDIMAAAAVAPAQRMVAPALDLVIIIQHM
jgi:hypothetical protein